MRETKTDDIDCDIMADYARKNHICHERSESSADGARLKERTRVRQRLIQRFSRTATQLRRDMDILCPGLSQMTDEPDSHSSMALLKHFCLHYKLFAGTAMRLKR